MSQLDREKDFENNDQKQVDPLEGRLPVGKLKWSQKEEQRTNEVVEAEFEVTKEEEQQEERIEIEAVAKDESLPESPKVDKLTNFEDTMSPLEFKEYKVELEQHQEASAAIEAPPKENTRVVRDEIPSVNDKEEDRDNKDDFKSIQQPSFSSWGKEEEDNIEYRSPLDDHKDEDDSKIMNRSFDDQQDVYDEEEVDREPELQKKPWRIALKILWIPMLLIVALITGLIIGNTVIGGQPISDIFDWDSWEHLYNLIYQK